MLLRPRLNGRRRMCKDGRRRVAAIRRPLLTRPGDEGLVKGGGCYFSYCQELQP